MARCKPCKPCKPPLRPIFKCLGAFSLLVTFFIMGLGIFETIFTREKTHIVIAMLCLIFCNFVILLNIVYLTRHYFRGYKYTYMVSVNYFLYMVAELISAVIIITSFNYIYLNIALSILVSSLFVILFFFAFVLNLLHAERNESDVDTSLQILDPEDKTFREKIPCFTISLYGQKVNEYASTSNEEMKENSVKAQQTE